MASRPEPDMGTEGDVLGKRVLAIIIDSVLMGVIAGLFFITTIASVFASQGIPVANIFLPIFFLLMGLGVTFFYAFLLEGYKGQTVGKMVMNIVVVKEDGSPCDYMSSFLRNLLRLLDGIMFYLVGLLVIIVSDKNQRLGDHVAGTLVVETRK